VTLPSYALRPATVADAALIQRQRDAMFTEMGQDTARLAQVHAVGETWLRGALGRGLYTGVLAEAGAEVVAGAGVLWQDLPPNVDTSLTVRAYILNVYVLPEHRGRKLARRLVEHLLAECGARGVRLVSLHASDAGRSTYAALGFTPTNELRLVLPGEGAA
jgi:ribosomal protein S18 acetylase RimI-like enzyme